jgi:hypothetical protein
MKNQLALKAAIEAATGLMLVAFPFRCAEAYSKGGGLLFYSMP